MSNNSNLHAAKKAKNDEFYTRLDDISEEMYHYKDQFKDKIVFCNCDDPTWSAFWKYFHLNFNELGLKKLMSTHYDTDKATYKMEYTGENDNDVEVGTVTRLNGNGDFRNKECINLLDECDIVVTNPPFSLFKEYIPLLIEHEKKFLVIGNMNGCTFKEIFPLFKENKIWLGYNHSGHNMKFNTPSGEVKSVSTWWYTNLEVKKRHEKLKLWETYTPEAFPEYDNYDAIEIRDPKTLKGSVNHIPEDYDGIMGVPITFLENYCPDQFEILNMMSGAKGECFVNGNDNRAKFYVDNGNPVYARILIRKNK